MSWFKRDTRPIRVIKEPPDPELRVTGLVIEESYPMSERKGVWLGCATHPEGYTCWVRKGQTTYLWCNTCKGPVAFERDSEDLSIPARRAAKVVCEHWEDITWDDKSLKGWDFNEAVEALRDAL